MDQSVIGAIIRREREARGMTQAQLAQRLMVSEKAVSKWETGKGFPDVTMLEPIAAALGISAIELMRGQAVCNRNRAANLMRTRFYQCPACGNLLTASGDAVISCCGTVLAPLEAREMDAEHAISLDVVEDEYYVSLAHDMTREHQIVMLAGLWEGGMQLVRLYAEGPAGARLKISTTREVYALCSRHGLFRLRAPSSRKKGG